MIKVKRIVENILSCGWLWMIISIVGMIWSIAVASGGK